MIMKKCTTILFVLLGMAFLVESLSLNTLKDDKRVDVSKDNVRAEKRNLWQFGRMIKCATGRRALDYNNYGKWCGWGGCGVPVDGVDRCCKAHDLCYRRNLSCRPKTNVYHYSTSGKYPSCSITCNSSRNDQCESSICNCDKVAAECFARNVYDSNNKN